MEYFNFSTEANAIKGQNLRLQCLRQTFNSFNISQVSVERRTKYRVGMGVNLRATRHTKELFGCEMRRI